MGEVNRKPSPRLAKLEVICNLDTFLIIHQYSFIFLISFMLQINLHNRLCSSYSPKVALITPVQLGLNDLSDFLMQINK